MDDGMSEASNSRPRAPRLWWEAVLFVVAVFVPSTIYPFASAASSAVTPFGTLLAISGTAIVLLLLSVFRDIGPTFVEESEAAFQNRHAADIYSIPVMFDVKPTLVPGFSRLRAKRADNSETIGAWALRLKHSRQVA
jgi:hypothetical protein